MSDISGPMPMPGAQLPAGARPARPEAPRAGRRILHFTDLLVWQKAFVASQLIFEASKTWPREERYALTDQVRRASRAIGANIAEAWGKRRYEAHFVSKLTDSDAEAHETEHWMLSARAHGYVTDDTFHEVTRNLHEIGRMLGTMISHPEKFLLKRTDIRSDI